MCLPKLTVLAQTIQPEGEKPTILSSEAPSLRFDSFGIKDGLVQGTAADIVQDSLGYMWIATQGGLVKYDGYSYETFQKSPFDTTSISDNFIFSISEGSNGNMWVATASNGLNLYNRSEQRFQHFRHDPSDSTSISTDQTFDVFRASNGDVWVTTRNEGLNRLPVGNDTAFVHYKHDPEDPNTITSNTLQFISEDPAGNIWVGSENGINRIDPETNEINRYFYSKNRSPSQDGPGYIYSQLIKNNGRTIWLGTGQGLVRLNAKTGDYKRFELRGEGNAPTIFQIMADPEDPNILWLGTSGNGVVRFDIRNEKIESYTHSQRNENSIAGDVVFSVMSDRTGNLWFGFEGDGLSTTSTSSADFNHFMHDPENPQSLAPGSQWGMIQDSKDKIWLSSGRGDPSWLTSIDPSTGQVNRHNIIDANTILGIEEATGGNIWLGHRNGLSLYDPKTKQTTLYPIAEGPKEDQNKNFILYITKDKVDNNKLWVASFAGVYLFDTNTKTYKEIPFEGLSESEIPSSLVIYQGSAGRIWVGTFGGLYKVEDNVVKKVLGHQQSDTTSLSSSTIGSIREDPHDDNILWIGTISGGLNRVDTKTMTATHYMKENGLSANTVYGMLVDNQGTLWMSTNNGISNFNPETETFRNYGLEDGLLELEFNQNAYLKDKNGRMYFGGKVLTSFKPGDLNINEVPPQVHVDNFKIFNELVKPGPDSPLKKSMEQTESITIDYDQSEITFEYVALHFVNPKGNTYKYQLEGFDKDWVNAGTKRSATYTNLGPGTYTFKVKAANSDGIWNTKGDQVTLTVLPPWYRTWWAYGLFSVLIGGLIFGIVWLQRRRLMKKEQERAKLREAELRAEAENKRRADTEQLSKIGRTITSSLSVDKIINTIYQNVNDLMDATIFGVGIYNAEKNRLEFPATKEKGDMLPVYAHSLDDQHRLSVYSFKNKKEVVISDYENEYDQYINKFLPAVEGEDPQSIIYLPLVQQDEAIGVITIQSFEKDAYSEYHVNLFRNLATYAAIALDNASAYRQLNNTLEELKDAQSQLIQQEKLASLGQLTAGIAHEIKNPLNFVNNFSDLSVELIEEAREELEASDTEATEEALNILENVEMNLKKIHEHGSRADSIVKSMLQHSREGSGKMEPTNVNALIEEYVNLSFHGMRASKNPINVDIQKHLDESIGELSLIAEDFSRVIVNLCNNAFDAMRDKLNSESGIQNSEEYHPKLTIRTLQSDTNVVIEIEDNGPGMSEEMKDKIMQPFFTTKKGTEGTGLGLSITNDVIKAHGGKIDVESTLGEGTKFIITI